MTPQIIHRYAFTARDAIQALLGSAAADCNRWEIKIDCGQVVIDLLSPVSLEQIVVDEGSNHEEVSSRIAEERQETDEATVEAEFFPPEKAEKTEEPKGGQLATAAGIICNEGAFWLWASEEFNVEVRNANDARELILRKCGITSRRYLDHNQEAAEIFREIRSGYQFWMNEPA
ncbi:hypothetical protein [Mesorhizobium sp. ANAO-SY3R2]|uniref:hypothetical protein n=1 Tax=Mesorhizobium sp. ANAO-SY3R2 TaxID=3166644 RepID=UPI00366CB8D3